MDDIFDITPSPSEYRTQKHVVISSRWIKVPHFILSLIAILFLVWSICFELMFLETGGVHLNTALRLKYPMTNYETCTDTDMDCEFHALNSSLEYCRERATAAGRIEWENNNNSHEVLERHVRGCLDVDIHDDDLAGDKLLIPTMVTTFHQRKCGGEECQMARVHRGWITERIEGHFVTDIESFTVSIAHTYQVDRLSMRGTGTTEQGFLDDTDGNRCIITCTSDCGSPHSRRWGVAYPPCGSNAQQSGNASYSSHRGDVFSVGRLLRAAGIELDSARPEFGNLSARVTGLALTLDIIYDNQESFWVLPWGPKIKYVYKPYESSFGVREELYKTFVQHVDSRNRVLERYTGIVLRVHTDGAMGQFSLVHFVYAIASFLALLKIADVVVERFLVPAYGFFPCTAHIPRFFTIHKAEKSIAEDRFMERQGRLAEISLDADDDAALRSGFEQAYLKRDETEILEYLKDTLLMQAKDSD